MDEQLVARDELATYATLADLGYANERVDELQVRAHEDRERVAVDFARINGSVEILNDRVLALECVPTYYSEINRMNDEITQIREALIDIQDSLRRLGMDDMRDRLGDLNLLLT